MAHDHIVELPKAVWGIKIVQSIIALLVLAFSAFTIAVIPNGYSGFCIFTAIYSGIALIYYFISIHSNKSVFNWVAILVLECFNVLWWLIVWALLAAGLAAAAYVESNYNNYSYSYSQKRDLAKRFDSSSWYAAGILVYVTLAIGLINWILYIVALILISMAIHRHRKAGKPMQYGGCSNAGWNHAPREEKHDMQPMPAAPVYSNYAPSNGQGQSPMPAPMHYEHQPQQAYPPQQPTQVGYNAPGPVPANTHEVYGGNRYP